MKIIIQYKGSITNIKLIGSYSIEEMHAFNTKITNEIKKKPAIIALDFRELKYIDSSGIGSIIRYMNIAKKENIDFLCYGMNEEIGNVFTLTKLDQFVKILSTDDFTKLYSPIANPTS